MNLKMQADMMSKTPIVLVEHPDWFRRTANKGIENTVQKSIIRAIVLSIPLKKKKGIEKEIKNAK